jgi:hypothetical protein
LETIITSEKIDLIIFTCQGREHLLLKSYASFKSVCDYQFGKTILAIDGPVDSSIITEIKPDLVMQHTERRGYVNSIAQTVKVITSPYFFWLEDDWSFNQKIDLPYLLSQLQQNNNWAEIVLSKYGPLSDEMKLHPLVDNLYQSIYGFSANPAICNAGLIQDAFNKLANATKGDTLGEDGFENFLSKKFETENIKCVILDPVDQESLSHEGYLESTPRNWHMTNSLNAKTKAHLLTIPPPSFARRCYMVIKLFKTFASLATRQLSNNKVYEYCFRVIATAVSLKNDDSQKTS